MFWCASRRSNYLLEIFLPLHYVLRGIVGFTHSIRFNLCIYDYAFWSSSPRRTIDTKTILLFKWMNGENFRFISASTTIRLDLSIIMLCFYIYYCRTFCAIRLHTQQHTFARNIFPNDNKDAIAHHTDSRFTGRVQNQTEAPR